MPFLTAMPPVLADRRAPFTVARPSRIPTGFRAPPQRSNGSGRLVVAAGPERVGGPPLARAAVSCGGRRSGRRAARRFAFDGGRTFGHGDRRSRPGCRSFVQSGSGSDQVPRARSRGGKGGPSRPQGHRGGVRGGHGPRGGDADGRRRLRAVVGLRGPGPHRRWQPAGPAGHRRAHGRGPRGAARGGPRIGWDHGRRHRRARRAGDDVRPRCRKPRRRPGRPGKRRATDDRQRARPRRAWRRSHRARLAVVAGGGPEPADDPRAAERDLAGPAAGRGRDPDRDRQRHPRARK
ncbi:LigA [Patulibacter medicamentivorans]|uniref:LigA n=1 Tax=Patulibacter medicamentivorans TaxID=1097667 RepID=H0EA00_9ACTN|nr:LigA [Patulibacter medicamentivorans]